MQRQGNTMRTLEREEELMRMVDMTLKTKMVNIKVKVETTNTIDLIQYGFGKYHPTLSVE